MSVTEEQKASKEILKEFFEAILKSKLKDYAAPKNTCYKFIDSLTSTCSKSKSFEGLLEKCFERIDEYTDRRSDDLPNFYLRSKVDKVPDLAIEIETSEWIDSPDLKEHKLTIRDIEFLIRVKAGSFIPKEVIKLWDELENELKKFEMYLKELSHKQKEELNEDIKNFLEGYFNEKVCKNLPCSCIARAKPEERREQGNQSIFIVLFNVMWNPENIDFYTKIIEESKKKFENLRKVKSDKLDKNHHLELLFIKVTSFATKTLEDHVKELYEKLVQKGYDYPIYLVADSDNSLNRYFIVCMK
jgi:disulfide oxidoreductase YuzD